MVANGDGNGRSAGKLDDAAAMRLLSKLYDRDDDDLSDRDAVEDRLPAADAVVAPTPASESAMQAEASLRELRSVFANMRESMNEEPPSRGLDVLLQAARANVSAKAVAPRVAVTEPPLGFWAKLRSGWMNMMVHPGVMAAAALVVVAGAAGTIYLKTGAVDGGASEQQTQSSVSSTTVPTGNVKLTAPDSPIVGGLAPVAVGSNAGLPSGAEAGKPDQPADERPQTGAKERNDKNVVAPGPVGGGGAGVNGNLDGDARSGALGWAPSKAGKSNAAPEGKPTKKPAVKPSPNRAADNQATDDSGAGNAAATEEQEAFDDGVAPGAPTSAQQPSPPPPPPPAPPPVKRTAPAEPATKAPVQRDSSALDDAPVAKPSLAKPTPQPAALLTAAKVAAGKGDCTQARSLAEQARVVDKRAYDLALKNDATLRACYQQ